MGAVGPKLINAELIIVKLKPSSIDDHYPYF